MGSMTFVKENAGDKQVITFDSSPAYSICKQHGYHPSSFRLEKIEETDRQRRFNVYASYDETVTPDRAPFVGQLTALTRAEIFRRQSDPYICQ